MTNRKGKELNNNGIIEKRRSKSIESSTNVNLREEACKQIARFFYNNTITLEVAKSEDFQKMCYLWLRSRNQWRRIKLIGRKQVFLKSVDASDMCKTVDGIF
ncbi:hypothetical protein CR513_57440, partial [Mucuna pruriens]